ncbi:MAG: TRAP transporter large permease subunit [Rhodospirillales bacterium]|nr:TRAP transporter large permease subunit [Rhodospirillales bacterium]
MEWWWSLSLLLGTTLALVFAGMPVALAFLLTDVVGALLFFGGLPGLKQLASNLEESLTTFSLLPVPLFILMGELMFHSQMGAKAIDAVEAWIGRVPGRLALVSVFSGTLFSTVSGSSVATTAFLGSQLLPEMERRGYSRVLSMGSIMGSGGLAMMIPPSAIAILLAALANVSAGGLLIAGILPGILMAICYVVYIVGITTLKPELAPPYAPQPVPLAEKLRASLTQVAPLAVIIFLVVGLIFFGVATPSESAALGALGTAALAAVMGRMNWDVMKRSLMGATRLSAMMFLIIAASMLFSQILAFSGSTAGLMELTGGLDLHPLVIVLIMQLILLVLGSFMDNLSMVMIAMPIFLPLIQGMQLDPMWFCLLIMINMDLANLTPPFGLLLFVMKGVAPVGTTMRQIYLAGLPFVACDLIVMGAVMLFPSLALWLPSLMR